MPTRESAISTITILLLVAILGAFAGKLSLVIGTVIIIIAAINIAALLLLYPLLPSSKKPVETQEIQPPDFPPEEMLPHG